MSTKNMKRRQRRTNLNDSSDSNEKLIEIDISDQNEDVKSTQSNKDNEKIIESQIQKEEEQVKEQKEIVIDEIAKEGNECTKQNGNANEELNEPKQEQQQQQHEQKEEEKCIGKSITDSELNVVLSEVRVNVTRLLEQPVTNGTESNEQASEHVSVDDTSLLSQEPDETNASVFVNYNDTTTQNDVTVEIATPSFIESTKNMSYGEALRCLTSRRNVHNLKSNYDIFDGVRKFNPVSQKRKFITDSPDDVKRIRIEEETTLSSTSNRFFSFLPSPFRFSDEPTCSTPILTKYKVSDSYSKTKHDLEMYDDYNKSNIEQPELNRKWCTIM